MRNILSSILFIIQTVTNRLIYNLKTTLNLSETLYIKISNKCHKISKELDHYHINIKYMVISELRLRKLIPDYNYGFWHLPLTTIMISFILTSFLQIYTPVFGQAAQKRSFNVADETALKIKSSDYFYYNFNIDPSWINVELIGDYSEENEKDVTITLLDRSTCNAPDTSNDFDIDTCNKIFAETDSSGNIDKIISPGRYYLKVESPDEKTNVRVTLHFDIKYDLPSNLPPGGGSPVGGLNSYPPNYCHLHQVEL